MIVLNSNVRVSRNLSGYNFVDKLDVESAKEIENKVSGSLQRLDYNLSKTVEMNSLDKLELYESDAVSGDIFKHELISGVYRSKNKPVVFLNETDHLVLQNSSNILNLEKLYDDVDKLDDYISESIEYAFSEKFGYLTSNPNFCGNAMTASVTLHIPAIAYFGAESLTSSLNRLGYHVNKLKSDNGNVDSIIKISPDRTIGITEREYLSKLENITREIMDMEEQNRKTLYLDFSNELEDKVNRAYGILLYSRMICETELIEMLSDLFLGIELSIFKTNKELDLAKVISKFKNGRLQIESGSLLDMKSRNILRAREVRKMMKEVF